MVLVTVLGCEIPEAIERNCLIYVIKLRPGSYLDSDEMWRSLSVVAAEDRSKAFRSTIQEVKAGINTPSGIPLHFMTTCTTPHTCYSKNCTSSSSSITST